MAEVVTRVCDGCGKKEKFVKVPERNAIDIAAGAYASTWIARSNLHKWHDFDLCDKCAHVADMVEEYLGNREETDIETVEKIVSDSLKRAMS